MDYTIEVIGSMDYTIEVIDRSLSRAEMNLIARLDDERRLRYARGWRPLDFAHIPRPRVIASLLRRRTEKRRFSAPSRAFLVAYAGSVPIGCTGIARVDEGTSELCRMYVVPSFRRKGVAAELLRRAEAVAAALGYSTMWLETGPRQPEAIRLYERHGYRPIRPWGRYRDHAGSLCFGKRLP
jgi:GNAT superfamily N-acetyltransferase